MTSVLCTLLGWARILLPRFAPGTVEDEVDALLRRPSPARTTMTKGTVVCQLHQSAASSLSHKGRLTASWVVGEIAATATRVLAAVRPTITTVALAKRAPDSMMVYRAGE